MKDVHMFRKTPKPVATPDVKTSYKKAVQMPDVRSSNIKKSKVWRLSDSGAMKDQVRG